LCDLFIITTDSITLFSNRDAILLSTIRTFKNKLLFLLRDVYTLLIIHLSKHVFDEYIF